MGDKTQLATLLLSAQSQSPWIVFVGAGTALIATSLVGVLLGRYLAKVLSPRTLDIAAGMLLMVISILLLGDVVQLWCFSIWLLGFTLHFIQPNPTLQPLTFRALLILTYDFPF